MREIKMETQRARPHINTAPGLAQIHRHANNSSSKYGGLVKLELLRQ